MKFSYDFLVSLKNTLYVNLWYAFHLLVVFQSLSCTWLFKTSWTAAYEDPLSFTVAQNLLKFISIESAMVSNHLILYCPLLLLPSTFLSIKVFPMSWLSASGGQSIGASASASILQISIQDWFPLGWTGWISLQSKGLWRVFSNTTFQKHQFFSAQLSLWSNSHIDTWLLEKSIVLTIKTFVGKVMFLLFTLSRFVIVFLSRSKYLLISWLQS